MLPTSVIEQILVLTRDRKSERAASQCPYQEDFGESRLSCHTRYASQTWGDPSIKRTNRQGEVSRPGILFDLQQPTNKNRIQPLTQSQSHSRVCR